MSAQGRQCQCGGTIRTHRLTNDREAWTCNACGRYEAMAVDVERRHTRGEDGEQHEEQAK